MWCRYQYMGPRAKPTGSMWHQLEPSSIFIVCGGHLDLCNTFGEKISTALPNLASIRTAEPCLDTHCRTLPRYHCKIWIFLSHRQQHRSAQSTHTERWLNPNPRPPSPPALCLDRKRVRRRVNPSSSAAPGLSKNSSGEKLNHLEERLFDQAQARAPYTPLLGVIRVAYPNG